MLLYPMYIHTTVLLCRVVYINNIAVRSSIRDVSVEGATNLPPTAIPGDILCLEVVLSPSTVRAPTT